jgi:hypothetical protein
LGQRRTASLIYEGCGRAYLGEVEGANIIKIQEEPK